MIVYLVQRVGRDKLLQPIIYGDKSVALESAKFFRDSLDFDGLALYKVVTVDVCDLNGNNLETIFSWEAV